MTPDLAAKRPANAPTPPPSSGDEDTARTKTPMSPVRAVGYGVLAVLAGFLLSFILAYLATDRSWG